MGTLFEKLKSKLDSMSKEELAEDFEKITHSNFYNRWVEKVHNLSLEKRIEICFKIKNKYSSKNYINKEFKHGYEPREELFYLIKKYSEKYGKNIFEEKKKNNDILMFCYGELYLVDATFIVEVLIGQGTKIKVFTLKEYEEYQKYLKSKLYEKMY